MVWAAHIRSPPQGCSVASLSVSHEYAGGEIVPLDFPSNGAIVVVPVTAIGDDLTSVACKLFLEIGTLAGDMQ